MMSDPTSETVLPATTLSPSNASVKSFNYSNRANSELSIRSVSQAKVKAVSYDTSNHFSVLTQMQGSVWPRVLPYCIVNSLLTFVVIYLRRYRNIDLTFSDRGHTFMSLLVSFLVVARSNITYSRYMEARNDLTECMKNSRELVQHVVAFTRYETSTKARQWRSEVARRTVVLLRIVVSVLEYQTKGQHAWKIPELTKEEKKALLTGVGRSNERAPVLLTLFLRSTVSSHPEYLMHGIHVNKELRLLLFISNFMTAYHGLMKLVTTPFPFPLVQMARTFLFTWIFSLPFALVNDVADFPAAMLLIFVLTYGFVGLEYVSIELDDPFGDDPNDFDVLGLAEAVFEDIYVCIYDMDGEEAAMKLKKGIVDSEESDVSTERESTVSKPKKHKRYCSIDAWLQAKPAESKVGVERSVLLKRKSGGERSDSDGESRGHSPFAGGLPPLGGGPSPSGGGFSPLGGGLCLDSVFAPSRSRVNTLESVKETDPLLKEEK